MSETKAKSQLFEQKTISAVGVNERHGKPRDLFYLWFGVNIMPLTIVTGLLGPTVFGLNFTWTVITILLGNVVGSTIMALHSAQGVKLGVPQMLQSRGQFGAYGSVLVVLVVLAMYLGFLTSIVILAGQSLNAATSAISVNTGIIISMIITAAIVIFGYRIIHTFNRWMLPVFGIALVFVVVWALFVHHLPAGLFTHGGQSVAGILGMFSLSVVWQISYAPYVSDYSRYMPLSASPTRTFWMTWGGTTIGAVIVMLVGAVVGLVTTGSDAMAGLAKLIPGIAAPVMIVFALGAIDACVINLYGPVLTTITLGQTFREKWTPHAGGRAAMTIVWAVCSMLLALFTASSFVTHYSNFLVILLYFIAPWSTINLVDYYLVHHANYDIPSFFRSDGGIYGRFQWDAIAAYLIAFAAQVPFMNSTYYQGFLFKHMNGVDVTWLVGVAVSFAISYPLAKYYFKKEAALGLHASSGKAISADQVSPVGEPVGVGSVDRP
jgi:NCS1 family nucleobase:cation symporter-1